MVDEGEDDDGKEAEAGDEQTPHGEAAAPGRYVLRRHHNKRMAPASTRDNARTPLDRNDDEAASKEKPEIVEDREPRPLRTKRARRQRSQSPQWLPPDPSINHKAHQWLAGEERARRAERQLEDLKRQQLIIDKQLGTGPATAAGTLGRETEPPPSRATSHAIVAPPTRPARKSSPPIHPGHITHDHNTKNTWTNSADHSLVSPYDVEHT